MSSRLTQVRPAFFCLFLQQLQSKQAGMAFVHVKAGEAFEAQRPQHSHSADTEHDFLAEPIKLFAAVEVVRQCAVPLRWSSVTATIGTFRSAAERTVSPARMPKPPA